MVPSVFRHALARCGRLPICRFVVAVLVGLLSACGPGSGRVEAQQDQPIPSLRYHAAFRDFYEGEYKDALDEYRAESRGAIKTPQARWIDSICYETMVGECYYQMGHLAQALDHYTAALNLYVAYYDWMLRVKFSPAIRPSSQRTMIPWGNSSRQSRLGHYPNSMLIGLGKINVGPEVERGGVVQQAHFRSIQVQEIVRCTTLAIRRRTALLGPVCRHDSLTAQLTAALSRRPGPPNHWSEAWINVQLGLALVGSGREAQGLPYLQRAVVAAGEFDHPLTSTALLELGRLSLARGDFPAASKFFEEATYAAVYYPNAGVLEEAFRYGTLTHLLANRKGVYPPLAAAIRWARVKSLRQLHTSLLLLAAESYAVLGQTREAAGLLDEARLAIGRRQMGAGRIGARLNYLSALVLFQQKKIPEGDVALATAMEFMRQGSFWLFHITLADNLYTGGTISDRPRIAMDLYNEVLRDPLPGDWAADPMEALTVLLVPHPGPLERWFEVALQRRAHEKALEIADRTRRHRFYSTLSFGGRLQSLRWILEGPVGVLDQQSQLLRQDLLARYPMYDQLSQQARDVRNKLGDMPLVTEDPGAFKQQGAQLGRLAALSAHQEAFLREMAVRREPAGLVFPPLRSVVELQKSLPEGHAVLAFFATSRHLYGFLLNNKKYTYWQVGSPTTLAKEIVVLLRQMGHYQQNHELTVDELGDHQWKQPARRVLELILKGSQADLSQPLDELVMVPDGALWYLPFEALQVEVDGQLRPLISRFRIRYVPTTSMATWWGRGRNPAGNTAVVVGRLFPRDDDAVARAAFTQMADAVPGTVALKSPPPAPSSVYSALFDRLVVLDDVTQTGQGPYAWSPAPVDRGKAGSLLSDWFWLPWGGPEEIILPGFHTAAESSLKQVNQAALGSGTLGSEVFLSVCGLMSSGARTLLLSRWRTGGQTSYDLVREFVQELPHQAPTEALQRSIFLTAGSEVDLDAEPRIKRSTEEATLRANHPFFWTGYMLIDSGLPPKEPAPNLDNPLLEPDEPD